MSEDIGDRAESSASLPLVKTEAGSPGPAPPLLPLAARDAAEKQQVQAAMAMAAFYSQNPLWQAALARERLQQQQQQQLTAASAAAAAALSQLPGRPPAPGLGALGLPGLAGLLTPSTTTPSLALPDTTNRTDLFRDYLSKLAQSNLTSPTSLPQYLSSVSTSSLLKADDIKTENPLPASLTLHGRSSTSSNRRSTSPGSTSNDRNFLRDNLPFTPYFNLQRSLTSPSEVTKSTINRSPPGTNGRGRNGSTGREKVFTCKICNRSFGYKHVLQNHERTHTGEKPFECKECHKRFTRDHHLKTHMRLHTGEKPYSCPHCDRQFVQVANLRRHVRVHTGERPYKCELCPSDFSDSNQLKAHMLMHKGKTATPTFNTLKEELLFRHSLAAGFPLPQYPPAPGLLTSAAQPQIPVEQQQMEVSSHPSLSPESKETNGSSDSPSHNENLSDSNSEKRRSRKQKPRKMIFGENGGTETNTEEEDGGSSSRDRSPRDRHHSSSSYNRDDALPMQQEPEDLTVRSQSRTKEDAYLSFHASTAISDYDDAGYSSFNASNRNAKPARNRSEGSEGSLSASDPLSSHSTPNEKFRSDDLDDEKDEDDRGVSPPISHHPSMYNQLFGHGAPAAIQLGLAGAAVPLTRDYMEKESEMLAVMKKEISQQ